jgi:hypothetical protein
LFLAWVHFLHLLHLCPPPQGCPWHRSSVRIKLQHMIICCNKILKTTLKVETLL